MRYPATWIAWADFVAAAATTGYRYAMLHHDQQACPD
jgi:hypothetical protein